MLQDRRKIQESPDKIQALGGQTRRKRLGMWLPWKRRFWKLTEKSEELLRKISSSGCEELKKPVKGR
ncbi:MAG: hypothetical protein ACLUD2_05430 [Clostridium sp.]